MKTIKQNTLLRSALLFAAVVALPAASGPDNFSGNQGTVTLLNAFTQGWGYPGPLVETSPGMFAGPARLSGQSGRIFTLTSAGALTSIYTFPGSAILFPGAIQAVDGRLHSSQFNPNVNFSFDLKGDGTTYPQVLPDPPRMAVQTVSGLLYGTEANFSLPQNVFVSLSLSSTTTVIHNFTSQEGVAYGYPIIASEEFTLDRKRRPSQVVRATLRCASAGAAGAARRSHRRSSPWWTNSVASLNVPATNQRLAQLAAARGVLTHLARREKTPAARAGRHHPRRAARWESFLIRARADPARA